MMFVYEIVEVKRYELRETSNDGRCVVITEERTKEECEKSRDEYVKHQIELRGV